MTKSLNILVLNHRCLRHPEAGGAEVSLFEQARRWVADGHRVTVFCEDPGRDYAPEGNEVFEGITIKRKGNAYTLYLFVVFYLLLNGAKHDVVLDVWNGIPFLSSWLTRTPHVLLVNHVCGSQWRAEFPFPLSYIGLFLEQYVVRHLYPHCPVVTISPTTRDELTHLGFQTERIEIVYCGVEVAGDAHVAQFNAASQRIVYVGRVKRYKRVHHLVELFAQVKRVCPDAYLEIAGTGDALNEVRATVAALHLEDSVTLHGYISENTKAQLLTSATVFATPSLVEGWGLCVIEANAFGCPSVAYNVPGLSNSIQHNETGILAADDTEFVDALTSILQDTQLREALSQKASVWARRFTWDEAAAGTLEQLAIAAKSTRLDTKEIATTSHRFRFLSRSQ